jgi:signal transduction histidine kinase
LLLISALVAVITFFYYATVPQYTYYHTLFRDLYFLPLILAAVWFGLKGALGFSLAVTLLYLPFMMQNWQGLSPGDFNRLLEIFLFNAVTAILGAISDQEKAREKALRESESLAAMGRTLAGVAHDMRNPLTAIGGFTRLLQEKLQLDDDSRHKMDLIIGETDRLEAMVKDMLDFSRPLELGADEADINQVLRRSLLLLQDRADKQKVLFDADLQSDIPRIKFDPVRMEQVFLNLLSNALEASPEGERVVVRSYLQGDQVYVEVVDHGPGIPPEQREKIFTPFFTTKRHGTGLGLAIVIKIVHAHQGKIEVTEATKGGAVFRISLPAKK